MNAMNAGIEWEDLPQTVTRKRQTDTTTARGNATQSWDAYPSQSIQATIQPRGGRMDYQPEGMVPKGTHKMYCNLKVGPSADAPAVDVQEGDRIVDLAGRQYRVIEVNDEAGVGDHFRILLETLKPGGD